MGRLDLKKRVRRFRKRPAWVRVLTYTAGVLLLAGLGCVIYVYVSYGRIIDERLNGERERTLPRVYARPVELRVGQPLTVEFSRNHVTPFYRDDDITRPGTPLELRGGLRSPRHCRGA